MKYLFLFILLFFNILGNAQTTQQYLDAAEKHVLEGNYNAASEIFGVLLGADEKNDELRWKYSEACLKAEYYSLAEKGYQRLAKSKNAKKYPLISERLAQIEFSKGNYLKAKQMWQGIKNDSLNIEEKIRRCDYAIALEKQNSNVKIQKLPAPINMILSPEISPIVFNDTLYFASLRQLSPSDREHPISKIYMVAPKKQPTVLKIETPKGYGIGHPAWNIDGTKLFCTLTKWEGNHLICKIAYAARKRNGFDKIKLLSATINTPNASTTMPSIAYDSLLACEVLYFVSNNKAGLGGFDIWRSEIHGDSFYAPHNMKAINTPNDDISPFFHIPTQKLYFASTGYAGLGGYDIFSYKDSIKNMGGTINTVKNEYYYWLSKDQKNAYFAADTKSKDNCSDIYNATFLNDTLSIPKNTITPKDSIKIPIPTPSLPPVDNITKVPETLEDFLPLSLYFDNDYPDPKTRKKTTIFDYEQTYFQYYDKKNEYIEQFIAPLNSEQQAAAADSLDSFFENKVKKGYDFLDLFANILIKRLEKGDKVEIFLKGYTSPRATSNYNDYLAARRIDCVRNYFEQWNDAIFQKYLTQKQLIISEKPLGETTANAKISDSLDDRRNSVYSPEASAERRVEIVEIKSSNN